MVQSKNILRDKIAPVENPVFTGLNNHSKESPELLDRGFFHIFSPCLIILRQNPNEEQSIKV
jgi:hypothetical protein